MTGIKHFYPNLMCTFFPQYLFRYLSLIGLVFAGYFSSSYAQENNSIISNWVNDIKPVSFTPEDTQLVQTLIHAAVKLRQTAPDSASAKLAQALKLSIHTGFPDGVANAYMRMGVMAIDRGNMDLGLDFFHQALPFAQRAVYDKELPAKWYHDMGIFAFFRGNYEEAANYFDQALLSASPHLTGKGDNFFITVYNALSSVYQRLGQYELAINYLNKAEKKAREKNLDRGLAITLNNKGNAVVMLGEYDTAYHILREALKLTHPNDLELQSTIKTSLGQLMLKQGRLQEAITFLKQTEKPDQRGNPLYTSIYPDHALGKAFYQLGNYPESIRYLNKAINIAKGTGHSDSRFQVHKDLSLTYEANGDFKKALEQQKIYEQLKDSLFNRKMTRDINELELKYRTAEKDKALMASQLQITRQEISIQKKNTWIWIVSLGILLLTSSFLLISWNYRHRQNLLADKYKHLEQEQEIKLLKASIAGEEQERIRIGRELHDGIGGLFSAVKLQLGYWRLKHKEISDEEDFKRMVHLVDEATIEMRKTAHNLMPAILLKNGIADAVRHFCNQLHAPNGPKIKIQIYGNIPRLNNVFELSLYRIIQELINNALKHANARKILLQFNWKDDHFQIAVEDDGQGMDDQKQKKKKGIGLVNIISRVEAHGGTIEIESISGMGTSIYLDFETSGILIEPQKEKT